MPANEINELCDRFVAHLSPVRVYMFGSFVDGTNQEQSDFDFYIVMPDGTTDIADVTTRAYRSIRRIKRRPVDIIVGTESRFNARRNMPTVENEAFRKGVLLYG